MPVLVAVLTSATGEEALTDADQKLPKSLQALLTKLAQPDTLPRSELVRHWFGGGSDS